MMLNEIMESIDRNLERREVQMNELKGAAQACIDEIDHILNKINQGGV